MINSSVDSDKFVDDDRFIKAVSLFNSHEWYKAHDLFEEIWHETSEPERKAIQAMVQIAVAQLHIDRGNIRGATILYGEALGRLKRSEKLFIGIDLTLLSKSVELKLNELQSGKSLMSSTIPFIKLL